MTYSCLSTQWVGYRVLFMCRFFFGGGGEVGRGVFCFSWFYSICFLGLWLQYLFILLFFYLTFEFFFYFCMFILILLITCNEFSKVKVEELSLMILVLIAWSMGHLILDQITDLEIGSMKPVQKNWNLQWTGFGNCKGTLWKWLKRFTIIWGVVYSFNEQPILIFSNII